MAANRDEQFDRPAAEPGPFSTDPAVVAPTDNQAGGTWIGVNEHGVVAGILESMGGRGTCCGAVRGKLVADVLDCQSAQQAADLVTDQLERIEYDGFFLRHCRRNGCHPHWLEWYGYRGSPRSGYPRRRERRP
ncbi:MAG: NRDE family protein [Natrialbaceae archaeon]|nr:NRDE family protein [Natrialbaceae archaeon]